jgi:hypothetical protein
MKTLDVPIEIEIYDGCATATPVLPARTHSARRPVRHPAAAPVRPAAPGARPVEDESSDVLQWSGALPAEVHVG